MRSRMPLPVLSLLAAVLALGGCGDSGQKKSGTATVPPPAATRTPATTPSTATTTTPSTPTTTTGALSKAELVRQAEAICKDVNAQVDKLSAPKSAAGYPAAARKVVALEHDLLDRLRKLQPPAELAQAYVTFQDVLVSVIGVTEQAAAARAANDTAKLAALGRRFTRVQAASKAAARPLGFGDCLS